jgi:hypothetical protein
MSSRTCYSGVVDASAIALLIGDEKSTARNPTRFQIQTLTSGAASFFTLRE